MSIRDLLRSAADDKVVTLSPDPDAMPPAMASAWRAIMRMQRDHDALTETRAAEVQSFASLSEKHQGTLARLDRDARQLEGRIAEEQERVILMVRALGIAFKGDEDERSTGQG